jgi:hypothetical protein
MKALFPVAFIDNDTSLHDINGLDSEKEDDNRISSFSAYAAKGRADLGMLELSHLPSITLSLYSSFTSLLASRSLPPMRVCIRIWSSLSRPCPSMLLSWGKPA